MDTVQLIQLLPGGAAATAVIVTVVLFLRQQEKNNETMNQMVQQFNARSKQSQEAFQDQINQLTNHQQENQKAFQNQIQVLIDSHIKLSKETITAVKALENTVEVMKSQIIRKELRDEVKSTQALPQSNL